MATTRERHPHAYLSGEEDPRTRQRTVPFEVINAGYSRTGTMTMLRALEILGYPSWHNVTMLANPPDIKLWNDALLVHYDPQEAAAQGIKPRTRQDFDHLLGYWSACSDQPACILTEELIKAYPDVKVVLVERDVEKWDTSFVATVVDGTYNPFIPIARWFDPIFMAATCRQTDLHMKYYFNVTEPRQHIITNNLKAKQQYMDNAKDTYRKHNEMVRRVVPKERLLEFKLEEGWGPLCEFLGKEIPSVLFPKVNETKAVQELVKVYIAQSYKRGLTRLGRKSAPFAVLLGGVALWYMRGT